MRRIVVDRLGVLVEVEAGEAAGALAPFVCQRIGEAEVVEEDVAFRLVEVVLPDPVLLVHGAEAGELPGDRLPMALGQGEHVLGAPHHVDHRPAEERLVVVVAAAPAPFVPPDELAVVPGEVLEKGVDGVVEEVDQVAFPHRPGGQLGNRDVGGDAGVGHG